MRCPVSGRQNDNSACVCGSFTQVIQGRTFDDIS